MSAIIRDDDIACASAAADFFGGNGLSTNQQVALVANLFAEHREKAEQGLRLATVLLNRALEKLAVALEDGDSLRRMLAKELDE